MHVVPRKTYYWIFFWLLVLLVATVGVTLFDLGPFNIVIALLIATTKAVLIVMYFMHLRWASALTTVSVAVAVLFLITLIGFLMGDYLTRGWLALPPS